MRTKKSLLAMMMAAACLFSMAAPMNAGATANCDLNGDGDVDVLDVIVFNRHLTGSYYITDPSALDFNGNLIVDFADSDYISAQITMQSYSIRFISSIAELNAQ